jgi:polyhydroxyalkanoate synthesis regulator phasin
MTLSHFFTAQLESEMKAEERVKKGDISADEADKFNEDWEDVSTL